MKPLPFDDKSYQKDTNNELMKLTIFGDMGMVFGMNSADGTYVLDV